MEFNEKLQTLRKQKNLTQEELAEALFVSRTAVSKWESGKGYPGIDSLKAMAKFFSVTVDDLLSGDELLTVAEEENKQKHMHFIDMIFGLLDISCAMFLFLPLFGQKSEGIVAAVPLLSIEHISPWLKISYLFIVIGVVLTGVLTLALQNCTAKTWLAIKNKLSLILNDAGVILFVVSRQPYAGVFLFVFLVIKEIMLMKKQ